MEIVRAETGHDRKICYRLRHDVFVVEQGVPVELELDSHDEDDAIHFLGRIEGVPVAASRLCLESGIAKIQRVVVVPGCRGKGLGRELIEHMMRFVRDGGLATDIALDAQTHAIRFYRKIGFEPTGGEFDDAGIAHIRMVQRA